MNTNIIFMKWLLPIITVYLIGSIPVGFIISNILKDDIRKHGSGNIGSTNMTRRFGKTIGILTFIFDCLKGFLAYAVITYWFKIYAFHSIILQSFVLIGHCYSVFLKFNGGKAVATSLALCFANNPLLALFPIVLWWVIFFIKKTVSISSIFSFLISLIISPILNILIPEIAPITYTILLLITTTIIIIRHKDNIVRIVNGEELDFKKSKKK